MIDFSAVHGDHCVDHLGRLVSNLNASINAAARGEPFPCVVDLMPPVLALLACSIAEGADCSLHPGVGEPPCRRHEIVAAVQSALDSVAEIDEIAPAERIDVLRHARDVVEACRALLVSG